MSELPKAGEEWFNRETLTVAKVLRVQPATETDKAAVVASCVGGCCSRFDDDVDTFLRDYARNEPVTPELLERMGFRQRFVHRGPELFVTGRFVINFVDGRLMTHDDEDEAVFLGPPSPTLCDLLNVLRVFGVQTGVNGEVG
jgi:hypothetical protein